MRGVEQAGVVVVHHVGVGLDAHVLGQLLQHLQEGGVSNEGQDKGAGKED